MARTCSICQLGREIVEAINHDLCQGVPYRQIAKVHLNNGNRWTSIHRHAHNCIAEALRRSGFTKQSRTLEVAEEADMMLQAAAATALQQKDARGVAAATGQRLKARELVHKLDGDLGGDGVYRRAFHALVRVLGQLGPEAVDLGRAALADVVEGEVVEVVALPAPDESEDAA